MNIMMIMMIGIYMKQSYLKMKIIFLKFNKLAEIV